MTKKIGLLTVSIALVTGLGACGGDDSGNGGSNGTGGTSGGDHTAECSGAEDVTKCGTCLDTAATLNETINALVICSCKNCADELAACFQSGNATEDQKCQDVVLCGQTSGCQGTECYCGVGVTIADCLANGPTGPCATEIATAAGCENETDPAMQAVCVQTARGTAGSTLAKASAVGDCTTGDPAMMVMGNCENL